MNNINLPPKHLLLVLLIVLIWGVNFVAVFIALENFPPFLLSALRFALSALPWVFFMPRPKGSVKLIVYYGLFNFALQFGFIFTGIQLGISPGLASLVLQIQVFFSMGLAFLFFQDRPSPFKIAGFFHWNWYCGISFEWKEYLIRSGFDVACCHFMVCREYMYKENPFRISTCVGSLG